MYTVHFPSVTHTPPQNKLFCTHIPPNHENMTASMLQKNMDVYRYTHIFPKVTPASSTVPPYGMWPTMTTVMSGNENDTMYVMMTDQVSFHNRAI